MIRGGLVQRPTCTAAVLRLLCERQELLMSDFCACGEGPPDGCACTLAEIEMFEERARVTERNIGVADERFDIMELVLLGLWYEQPRTIIFRARVYRGEGVRLARTVYVCGALQWFRNGVPEGAVFQGEQMMF